VDWDGLKFLLAVANSGSLSAAATQLNVTTMTVSKVIAGLEQALSCELVVRTPDGFKLTKSGEKAVTLARAIEAQVTALAAEVGGELGEIAGTVCVTSSEGFVRKVMPSFDALRPKFPGLDIDLMVSSHVVDLKQREADIAVRFFKDEQDGLAMRKLGAMGWTLYASEQYLAGRRGKNLEGHQVIGYTEQFSKSPGGRWIAANVPAELITTRVGGIRGALDAALSHQGVCFVPCYLACQTPLVRMTDEVLASNDAYAVYLAARAKEARMQVVVDTLSELFEREQSTFAGTAP
jgi:DNA-binding transcriptional LysR family regulator